MAEQRLRVTFCKGERVRYISHLDVLRYWERAIRRAGLPLSYSQGFTPHPRLTFAGPLPMGFLAEREPMDVLLDERVSPAAFREAVAPQTVPDLTISGVAEVPMSEPALQAALRWSDYAVQMDGVCAEKLAPLAAAFLAKDSVPYVDDRRDKAKSIDLREGVASLSVRDGEDGACLDMRLRTVQDLTVRPEMVIETIFPGYAARRITRTGIVLAEHSPARDAWMRRGRFLP